MKDLEAVDGEEATEDTLLEPGSKHDDVILFIHGERDGNGERESEGLC